MEHKAFFKECEVIINEGTRGITIGVNALHFITLCNTGEMEKFKDLLIESIKRIKRNELIK
jgi:hypothetical protein